MSLELFSTQVLAAENVEAELVADEFSGDETLLIADDEVSADEELRVAEEEQISAGEASEDFENLTVIYADEDYEVSESEPEEEIFEGSYSESRTYDGGKLPIVTDFGWTRPGEFYIRGVDEGVHYKVQITGPGYSQGAWIPHSGTYPYPDAFVNSGEYTIQVKTVEASSYDGDFTTGAVSTIKSINYTRPSESLTKPTGLHWKEDDYWNAVWDAVPGANYYSVKVYNGDKQVAGVAYRCHEDTPQITYCFNDKLYNRTDLRNVTFNVAAYNTDPTLYGSSPLSDYSPVHWKTVSGDPIDVNLNGLAVSSDGNWYLYENGVIKNFYSGLYNDAKVGWWLVLNGKVAFGYNDLYCDANVGWWKISGGAVDFGYTDLYGSPTYGWWKINGGAVDFGYTDLYGSPTYGWWKVNGGQVDFGYTDLYCSPSVGWWKINGGSVDFGYTDLYGSPSYGWWKINGGSVDFGYTDLYASPSYGWWLVNGGAVDFGYNDIFKSPVYGNWKIAGGSVDFGYTGFFQSPKYGRCYVSDGQATF